MPLGRDACLCPVKVWQFGHVKCWAGLAYTFEWLSISLLGLGLISARDILAWTFHHGNFSSRGHFNKRTFRQGYFFAPLTVRHGDVTALEHFGTEAPMPKCLRQNVYIALHDAQMYMCRNIHVPKYPCAEMFKCSAVFKCSPCAEMSMVPKYTHAEMFSCWNVLVPKISRDEMSVPKCLLPKCQVLK